MTERDLQNEVIKYLDANLPFDSLVHHSSNESTRRRSKKALGTKAGWPDIEIFSNGKVLFIELKIDKNKLSDDQKIIHARIKSNGFNVVTCWTLEEVKAALFDYKLITR